jgi:L-lactate dehydrogenase complex protein LldG
MTDAKADILAAIRRTGRGGQSATMIAAEAEALLAQAAGVRPGLPPGTLEDVFIARVVGPKVAATADRVGKLADIPRAVARYLEAHHLPLDIALQPDPVLLALDWSAMHTHGATRPDEAVAVGRALWGIAETGSLVLHSGPTCPTLFAFLPLHHIAVVEAATILPHLDDYRRASVALAVPRNVNFVTGPSGTTDIEGVLIRGAHGPAFLHVVVVG